MTDTTTAFAPPVETVKQYRWFSPRELPRDPGDKAVREVTFIPREPQVESPLKGGVQLQIPENTPVDSIIAAISYTDKGQQVLQLYKILKEQDSKTGNAVMSMRIKPETLLPAVHELIKTELGFGLSKEEQQKKAEEIRRLLSTSDIERNPLHTHFQRIPTSQDVHFTIGVLTPNDLGRYRFETAAVGEEKFPDRLPSFRKTPSQSPGLLGRLTQQK